MNKQISLLQKEVQVLTEEQRNMDAEVLAYDRRFEDKWKLLNEM